MDEVRIDLRKIGEDVGNYEVVVGNPAKCIKRLEPERQYDEASYISVRLCRTFADYVGRFRHRFYGRFRAAKFLVENGRHEGREISGGKNDEQAGGENYEQG